MYNYEQLLKIIDHSNRAEDSLEEQMLNAVKNDGLVDERDELVISRLIAHIKHHHPNPMILETDLEGNIIYANEEQLKLSKYTWEELKGQNVRVFRSGHMPAGIYQNLWATITLGKSWKGEIKNRAKDYETYWVDLIVSPVFNEEGEIIKYWSLSYDITENVAQKEENEAKNNDIMESLKYAKRIQRTILPDKKAMDEVFDDYFVIFKPKDIVSGDFYWFNQTISKAFVAVVDCTGHGVPGAFMSLIGYNLLNQIVLQRGVHRPGDILTQLHIHVRATLKQDSAGAKSKDGMDVCLLCMDKYGDELEYSGAYRPLFLLKKGELQEIKPDKYSIGGEQMEEERTYTNHELEIAEGDCVYMFSDGFVDQFGGPDFKKFSTKKLKQLINDNCHESMSVQRALFNIVWKDWIGDEEQTDDVSMIAIRF